MPNAQFAANAPALPFSMFEPVTVSRPVRSAKRSTGKLTTDLLPWEGPDEFCMVAEGVCMLPEIESGAPLIFDRREPCRPGDIVAIWRRKECTRPGEHQVLIKRLVSISSTAVRVEMNNPRRQWDIPLRHVHEVIRSMGPVPAHRKRVKVTDDEARALGRRSSQSAV